MSAQIVHPHVSDELKVKLGAWLTLTLLTVVSFMLAYFFNSLIFDALNGTVGAATGHALKPQALDGIYSWMAAGYTAMGVLTLAGLLRGSVKLKR